VYGTLSGVLIHEEATERATLIDTITCDVTLDLTVSPPRSRTVLRFRCRRPGATTFADLSAGTATLNDARIDPPEDGRLMLRGLQRRTSSLPTSRYRTAHWPETTTTCSSPASPRPRLTCSPASTSRASTPPRR
jgi:hypothetical protein